MLLLQQRQEGVTEPQTVDLYIAALGAKAEDAGFKLAHALRTAKLQVALDYESRSLKSQMKQANKAGAKFTLVLGDSEIEAGQAVLKEMSGDREVAAELNPDVIAATIRTLSA